MANFIHCGLMLLLSLLLVTVAALPPESALKLPTLEEIKERWAQKLQNRPSLSTLPSPNTDLQERLAERIEANKALLKSKIYEKPTLEVPDTLSDLRQRIAERRERNLELLNTANIKKVEDRSSPETISELRESIAERIENRRELFKSAIAELESKRKATLKNINNNEERINPEPVLESPQFEDDRMAEVEEEDIKQDIVNIFTTEAPHHRVLPLQAPAIEPTTPTSYLRGEEKLFIEPPSSTPEIDTRGLKMIPPVPPPAIPETDSVSSFDYEDFQTVRKFLGDVPRGRRVLHIGRQAIRRALHSFINNDNHNLEDIAPRTHRILKTAGQLFLPHPENLLLAQEVPSLIPEHVFQRRLRKKMTLQAQQPAEH